MPNLLQIIMYLIEKIKWQTTLIEKLSDYISWLEDDKGRPSKGTDITKLDYWNVNTLLNRKYKV